MCGNKNFILVDGYFNQPLQSNPSGITLGGRTLPSIAIVCSKCGFISNHALGSLDLLPPAEGDTK